MQNAPRFALSLAFGSCLAVSTARADQFVLTDVSYTHSTTTTKDSHYHVVPLAGTPKNWLTPVDYSKGSAYVRVQIKTKPPGGAPTRFQICFEGAPAYACTAQSMTYTTTGVQEWVTPFSDFYKGDGVGVDWSKGVAKVALILKDDQNGKPAPENVDAGVVAKYMPTDLHVVVGIVSQGATFKLPPDAGVPDAGATDAGAGDAGRADASGSDAAPGTVSDAAAGSDAAAQATDAAVAGDAQTSGQDAAGRSDAAASSDAATRADAATAPGDAPGDEADGSSDGGCSLAVGPRSRLSSWSFALLAALMFVRRRRARRDRNEAA
jgi:hypothetical protein